MYDRRNTAHTVELDDNEDDSPVIAVAYPASAEAVQELLLSAERSDPMWFRLANDHVFLGVYPHFGALHGRVEEDARKPDHLPDPVGPTESAHAPKTATEAALLVAVGDLEKELAFAESLTDEEDPDAVEWRDALRALARKWPALRTLSNAPEMAPAEVPDLAEFDTAKGLRVHFASGACVDLEPGWVNTNVGIHGRELQHDVMRKPYHSQVFVPWANVCMARQREDES